MTEHVIVIPRLDEGTQCRERLGYFPELSGGANEVKNDAEKSHSLSEGAIQAYPCLLRHAVRQSLEKAAGTLEWTKNWTHDAERRMVGR